MSTTHPDHHRKPLQPKRTHADKYSDHLDVFRTAAHSSIGTSHHTGGFCTSNKASRSMGRSSTSTADLARRRSMEVVLDDGYGRDKLEEDHGHHQYQYAQIRGDGIRIGETEKLTRPLSPGGRLARFITSIFHQGASTTITKKPPPPRPMIKSVASKSLQYSCKSARFGSASTPPAAFPDRSHGHHLCAAGRLSISSADGYLERCGRTNSVRAKEAAIKNKSTSSSNKNKNEIDGRMSNTRRRIMRLWSREENREGDDAETSDSSSDLFELPVQLHTLENHTCGNQSIN